MTELTVKDRTFMVHSHCAMHIATAGYVDLGVPAAPTNAGNRTAPVTKRRAPLPERTRDEDE